MELKVCFVGTVRRRTFICCRNVRISASSAVRDRNRSATIQTMSLTTSLIPRQHRPILDQLLVRLSLRYGPAAAELGGIDTIVCNVSALAVGNTPETWENSFRVDMMHTVNSVAAALPFLEKSGSASIVMVSSVSGFEIDFAAGSYGAFK